MLKLFSAVFIASMFVFSVVAQKKAAEPEPITLETPTGSIYGTLLVPPSKRPLPVVIIISGSGPTDRDGNTPLVPGANNGLRMLAEALAASGIASLRYDKRGIAASAKAMRSQTDVRFDDYVADAAMWAGKLRGDKRFSTITFAGHSEGSLIGMIAARQADADGYVSMAGVGRPANLILHDQLKTQFPEDVMKLVDQNLALLAAGQPVNDYPPKLASLFHPSIQGYMTSWFRYDPAKEIAKLKIPVLILQGTSDVQVSVEDAKLLSAGDPSAKLVIVDGMNHTLKQVKLDPELQKRAYSDPTMPVEAKLIEEISKYVHKLKRAGH